MIVKSTNIEDSICMEILINVKYHIIVVLNHYNFGLDILQGG